MAKETRLQRKMERQLIRKIMLSVGVLIVVVILFFMYGIQLLINLSLYLEKMKSGKDSALTASGPAYIAPPVINPMPNATNSAQVILTGYSLPGNTIKLYLNDHL